ncbi:MAG: hypothetical protein A2X78_02995 [Gammaproteobacteria bacterium GWE2_37_16]|nr:MAG: hypothetical protein A2X78_02995 [Gammaproteobacteria bacterium GWE2_37_16]
MTENAIECKNVYKAYSTYASLGVKNLLLGKKLKKSHSFLREWALENISFSIKQGTAFGIIGRNGSGKTTLLSLLLGVIRTQQGEVRVNGKIASLLELGAGFHPELTGRDNVFLYGSILGMRRRKIEEKYDSIVRFSELGNALDSPIRTYSSGMIARLGFSTIIHYDADVLLIDEVLAVGDAHFQQKCFDYLKEYCKKGGTLVIVSHSMESVAKLCKYGICLDFGKTFCSGEMEDTIKKYDVLMKSNF